ncbi:hypothetical protein IGI04_019218 [Brassica rapa subsp. trilocularis]|uniref:Uncharacterized protein n=1 Tax=Brassica rapa subsp. trilocularis TaxID=1813537 RepID=A0ABQ7MF73_BRACM|nr:hypothetical protein IGI04_019218 [Brassica rapa subsp. trilocularis]
MGCLFSTHRTFVCVRQHTQEVCGCPYVSVCVRQHRQNVCGCTSVHISARWSLDSPRWPFPWTVWVILAHVGCLFSTHRTSVGVRQHTQDVCGCLNTHRTSVAVRVCPCVSVCRQHTQDVHGCPSVHISARWSLDSARWPFPWTVRVILAHVGCQFSTHRMPVVVRNHTQDVRGCPSAHTGHPWLSVCVSVCPSAHTGRLWLSISTHISTLVLGLSTLALPVDSSGDFGPRGLSVQYTQDVCGCPSAHRGRLCVSVSTHRTSVVVRVCLWLSISTHISKLVLGLSTLTLPVDCLGDFGPRGLSVQYTQDISGCPPAHTGRLCVSPQQDVHGCQCGVRVCPCVSVSTHRTSVAVHQYTYQHVGPWTQHAGPSRGLFGRFWPTWAICSEHTGRLWVSVSTQRTFVCVRQHTQDVRGCPWLSMCVRVCLWLSISTHISKLVLGLSTLTLPVDCLGDFGPRGLSVQYTQDVRGVRQHTQDVRVCPSAHTGCPWLSVCVRVSVSTHRMSVAVLQDTYQHVGPWTQHADPSRGLFGQNVCGCTSVHISARWSLDSARWPFPWTVWVILAHVGCLFSTHRTSVGVRQHTKDVRGCPPAHTGRPWLSVAVRQHTQDVRGCPCVSVCVLVCPSAHTGRPWLSISTHISTLVLGLSTLALPVDCSGDAVLLRQQTQAIHAVVGVSCVVPSAHTGRLWLVHQYTYSATLVLDSARWPSRGQFGTHRTAVVVQCGCLWLSLSTHISTLVLGLSTLALPVDCLGDFGRLGLSVQYTQDVSGCPPAHTGRLWLSVSTTGWSMSAIVFRCVCVCPEQHTTRRLWRSISNTESAQHTGRLWVSVSTQRTFVCVRQHTQDVRGCPWLSMCVRVCLWLSISTHISKLVLGLSTLTLPVDCLGDFGPRGLSVQYTQDVRGCPPAHTGRPCVSVSTHRMSVAVRVCPCVGQHTQDVCGCPSGHISGLHWTSVGVRQHTQDVRGSLCVCVCVRLCPSAHTGHPWLSISTHISTLVPGLSRLALPVDFLGDFGPRGLSVQFTQDVRGCPSAHTGRCLFSTHRTSVGVRQHTDDVRVCPSAHTGRPWLSVCVRVCPCVSISTHRKSVAVHQYTYQHYTHDVRGCPPAHTGRPWLSVCVRLCPSAHTGRPRLSISTPISTLVLGLSTLALPVDCLGDFGPRGLSVQYTQDVCGCPPAHTGRLWLSVSTHGTSVGVCQHTQDVRGCPCVSVCVRQHTHDVRGCSSVHISAHWSLDSARWPFPWTVRVILAHVGCQFSTHRTSVGVRNHTQDVRGCPSAHTGHPWLSVCVSVCPSAHISTLVLGLSTLALPVDCLGDFGPRGLSVQYTQDVCGCPSAHRGCLCVSVSTHRTSVVVRVCLWLSISTHISKLVLGLSTLTLPVDFLVHTGRLWLSVCVRVCPSAHTGCLWLSISAHISTLVLGLSTLTLPVDFLGDFGPRGLSVQYIQDVHGCPPAHTGRWWGSVSTHRTSGLSVVVHSVSGVSVAVHQYTQTSVGGPPAHTGRPCVSRQHTQDVRGCPCVSVCRSAHTGRPWLSISTHISTLVLGLSMLALPVDCLGDFGPRGLSVQFTQDVRGCPSAHTGRPWLSVCVHVCLSTHTGRPWLSISTHISTLVLGLSTLTLPVDCSAHTGRPWLSVCVRVCPSAHTGSLWLSISTHISTLVLGLSTLTLPVDCSGDFWPTWAVCSVHTGRSWLSASTHRTSVAVRVCPSVSVSTHRTSVAVHQYTYQHVGPWTLHAGPFPWTVWEIDFLGPRGLSVQSTHDSGAHKGRSWLSISTHITTVVLGLNTLTLPVDCSGDFGPRGLSVQYTHDVCGCPPAHIRRLLLSECVRLCPSAHTSRPWLSISTHISTLVLGLSMLALPLDCLGDFGPRGLSVQYTHDDVRCCPGVSVSTHRTSVGVRQHTKDVRVFPPAHTGLPWLTLAFPVDSLGDFGPRGLSVQYTQDVCGCPPAHTGRLWQSVAVRQHTQDVCSCLCVSVCVRQHKQDVHGCPSVHISARWPFSWTVRVILAHVCCLFSTHRTSVGVRQHTQNICACPSAHTGRSWLSVCFRVCPSAHTGRPWLSISTHITTLVLGLSMLTLPVDCSGDFGPRGLSVQYTQVVRGCPPAHTGRPWLSVCVRVCPYVSVSTHRTFVAVCVCPCVSVSTHRMSVAVHQYTYQHVGLWTHNAGLSRGLFGTHRTFVGVRQHTQDVRVCLSAHTGRPWLSVCVCGCPSAHTGRLWLSISTHISTLVLGLSTLALPVDCSGDFSHVGCLFRTHRTSVGVRQHTEDVCVCPPAHTGRPWLSVCVCVCPSAHKERPWLSITTHITTLVLGLMTSVGIRQHTQDVCGSLWLYVSTHRTSVAVRVCPSAHTGRPWLSISTHISTLVLGLSMLTLPVDCSGDFGPRGLSVQYTHDVRGCPPAHTGRPWLSVCVRVCPYVSVSTHRTFVAVCVCPCVSVSTHRMSVAVHQYTYQHVVLGLSTLTLPVDCLGDFGPRGLSVQYTQDVRGCQPAHTGRPWLSVCVRVCPSVSVSTHRTSLAVHQYTYQHVVPWTQHADPSRGLFGTLALPVDCLGDSGPRGLSVQYTQDIRGCPPEHTGRPWLSVAVCQHTQDIRGCPCVSVSVRQHTQDVCGCPSAHTGRHTGRPWVSASTHRTSVAVCGCPSAHTGHPWLSVCVRVCLSAHTGRLWVSVSTHRTSVAVCVSSSAHTRRPWLSISTHISTMVLGLSTLALPMDYLGDFSPRGLSVQYKQDVCGCPSAHTGRSWLSVYVCVCPSAHTGRSWLSISTHISTLVLALSTLSLPMDCSDDFGRCGLSVQYTQDVRGCPSAHTGRPCVSVSTQRTSVAVRVCRVCLSTHRTFRGCPSVHISALWSLDSAR